MLVAIFGEKDSHAVYYLHQQGVTRLDVVNFISHGIQGPAGGSAESAGRQRKKRRPKAQQKESPLDQFTQNLNQLRGRRQDRSADRPRARRSSA